MLYLWYFCRDAAVEVRQKWGPTTLGMFLVLEGFLAGTWR